MSDTMKFQPEKCWPGWADRRESERVPATGSFFYSPTVRDYDPRVAVEYNSAFAIDVSEGGACVETDQFVEEGYRIKLYSRMLGDAPVFGTVQWCRESGDLRYRIGISIP